MGRPRSEVESKTTTITFPVELLLKLKHYALDNNTSVSQILIRLADEKFNNPREACK